MLVAGVVFRLKAIMFYIDYQYHTYSFCLVRRLVFCCWQYLIMSDNSFSLLPLYNAEMNDDETLELELGPKIDEIPMFML